MKNYAFLFRFILLLTSSFAAFLMMEAGYRVLMVDRHQYSVAATGNQYEFYEFDPQLGWANTPGARGNFQREEFSYRVSINQDGMRQQKIDKQKSPSTFRVAVLGDSFVWGIGVSDEQRFTEILQKKLPNSEVLNFGTSGYSPVQYLLMLDDVIEFQPDLVIIAFCLGNDFTDNVLSRRYGYYKPYATLDEHGGLVLKGYPIPNVKKFGFQKTSQVWGSFLLAELRERYSISGIQQAGLVGFSNELLHTEQQRLTPEQRRLKSQGVRINEAILAKIHQKLNQHRIPLVVASAPTKREYNPSYEYGHQGYYPAAERILMNSAKRLGIDVVANVHHLNGEDFWVKDGHWNLSGHQKIAAALATFIVQKGYGPGSKPHDFSPD